MKKVSIIVPIYNMGDKLKRFAVDLLEQTYTHTEIILVDDGSTDNTLLVCEELARQDPRIKIIHTENQGSGLARNTGLLQASGDYAYFADADDNLAAEAIEMSVAVMERDDCDLVIFGHQAVDPRGRSFHRKNYVNCSVEAEEIRHNYTKTAEGNIYSYQRAIWNKLFSVKILRDHDIQFSGTHRHDEELFITRCLSVCHKISFMDQQYYTYNKDDYYTILGKLPINYIDEVDQVIQEQKSMFIAWNPDNQDALDFLRREYAQRLSRSLELSFHKKMGFDRRKRLEWLRGITARPQIQEVCATNLPAGSRYQNMILALVRAKNIPLLYLLLWLKNRKNLRAH